jgi:general secretion pathway protein A
LLQIVLAGQNELADTMNREDCVQLKQRVSLRVALRPLAVADVGRYIACRWARAGGRQRAPFSQQAVELTARVSQGIPRLINVVCDNALMAAFGDQSRVVEASHVSRSCEELDLLDGVAEGIEDSELVEDVRRLSMRNKFSASGR